VATAYDAEKTARRAWDLHEQGNGEAALSQIEHFGWRTMSGFDGAAVGAEMGSFGGPVGVALGGVLGGGLGALAGEPLAKAYDTYHVYHQTDPHGQTWQFDPTQPQHGWTRTVIDGFAERGLSSRHVDVAPPALAERLTYQAHTAKVEQALGHPPTPRDPFTQPAGVLDTPSKGYAPWVRDEATHTWRRQVIVGVMEHGLLNTTEQIADPSRAAQLEQAAQQTMQENLSNTPVAMAQTYQALYEHRGWQQYGPMPEAVTHALRDAWRTPPHVLPGSDGHAYTRGDDGQWTTPGTLWGTTPANTHLRAELDATDALRARAANAPARDATSTPARTEKPAAASPAHGNAQAERDPDSLHARLDRMLEAGNKQDWKAFHAELKVFADMQPGRDLMAHGKAMAQRERQLTQQHQAEMQQMRETLQDVLQQQAPQRGRGMAR
jgi:hypothetical protein